jgi:hypothetical protein
MSRTVLTPIFGVVAAVGLSLVLPVNAKADALCTTSGTVFNVTITPRSSFTVTLQDLSDGGSNGAECAVINFTNLTLLGPPVDISLTLPNDNPTGVEPDISDVLTLANNAAGHLQACIESDPFSFAISSVDCPVVALPQFFDEADTNVFGPFATTGAVPGLMIQLLNDSPTTGTVSDVITFTAVPEPSSIILIGTALFGMAVVRLRRQLGAFERQ